MHKTLGCLFSVLIASSCNAGQCKPFTVAILDTGFGYQGQGKSAKLCKYGHMDFSLDQKLSNNYNTKVPVPIDSDGHGTNIAGIIDGYAAQSGVNYCLVILKYYSENQTVYSGNMNILATVRAINYAKNIHIDYINYSGGGESSNSAERDAVKAFLDQGGRFISSAMNDGRNLDQSQTTVYPAGYDDRIYVVGSLDRNRKVSSYSNYGSLVKNWEIGENVMAFGLVMSGTSQATAVKTGKMLANNPKTCNSR